MPKTWIASVECPIKQTGGVQDVKVRWGGSSREIGENIRNRPVKPYSSQSGEGSDVQRRSAGLDAKGILYNTY